MINKLHKVLACVFVIGCGAYVNVVKAADPHPLVAKLERDLKVSDSALQQVIKSSSQKNDEDQKEITRLKTILGQMESSSSGWRFYALLFAVVAAIEGWHIFGDFFDFNFDEEETLVENDPVSALPTCDSPLIDQPAESTLDQSSSTGDFQVAQTS